MATALLRPARVRRVRLNRVRASAVQPWHVFALVAAAATAWLTYEGRHFTFQSDEWDWLLHRRGHALDVFLKPHNEHLSAIPIAIYKAFFSIFGAQSTLSYRLLDTLLVVVCAALVFVLASRRVGGWVALCAATILLFFGPAWNDIIWGFQIGYLGALAAGLGAFLALEREDRRGDVIAAILLTVGLACSSVGLTLLAGAIVEVVLTARRRGWSQLWVVAVPMVLYGLWYSHYGVSSVHLSYFHNIPSYAFTGLAAVVGSITGLAQPDGNPYVVSIDPGTTIAVLVLVAFAYRFVRGAPLSIRFWAVSAAALAFWAAAALSYIPGREANQGRYTFPVAPMVMLAAAECVSGWRPHRRWLVLLGVGSVAAVASNLGFLNDGANLFDITSRYARAELGALDVARGTVLASFEPESGAISNVIGVHNMTPIDAGSYFSAASALGTPADSVPAILSQPEAVREAADFVLAKAERLGLAPARPVQSGCVRHAPTGGFVQFTLGSGQVTVTPGRSAIDAVALRRFASAYNFVSLGRIAPGTAATLTLPHDRSALPWNLSLKTQAPVSVCGA